MECDPTRVCELLVGLGDVEVLGVDDDAGGPLRVHIRRRAPRPDCERCGGPLWSDRSLAGVLRFGRSGAAPSGDHRVDLASAPGVLWGLEHLRIGM